MLASRCGSGRGRLAAHQSPDGAPGLGWAGVRDRCDRLCGKSGTEKPSRLTARAAEESLEVGLDIAGLKAQKLQRVETLQERRKVLAGLVPATVPVTEVRGDDTRAVMSW